MGTISKYIQQHRQISVGFEIVRASFQKICKGHFGSFLAIAFLGGLLAVWALVIALFLPQFRWPAALLVLGYLIVAAVMVVAMLARTTGYLLDLAANVSLQSQLKRVGFSAPDFFVDGGAGSPTLQLTLVKVLSLCKPNSILELGSGQTTKILAHYGRSNPSAQILTIEESPAWHSRLSIAIAPPTNHQYCCSPLHASEVVLPNNRGVASTNWYSDGEALLLNRRFQLILVDGPTNYCRGDQFVPYSRSGLLPYLPSILADSFVVLIDDTENYGYLQTARAIRQSIVEAGRSVRAFEVHGVKSQTVLCSPDLQFLQSV